MAVVDASRPQDQGRPHRRTRGAPGPETEALLERYRAAMRAELADLLTEIRPSPPSAGQLAIDGTIPAARPKLEERRALWELAIKLGRELSTVTFEPASAPAETGRRADAKAPRLSRRDRIALGQD